MPKFKPGDRVYHIERDEYGEAIAEYEFKHSDNVSTYVKFDESGEDVFEVPNHLLQEAVPQLDPRRLHIGERVRIKEDPCFEALSGQVGTIVGFGLQYTNGRTAHILLDCKEYRLLNEIHLERIES